MFECAQSSHLVVDTGAIIQGAHVERLGKELWTIREVVEEVRDPKARVFLDTLPVPIKPKDPTAADIKAVVDFAKKTGDYANLSVTDIRVLALTYMLERENNGIEHLRTEPKAKTIGPNAKITIASVPKRKRRNKKKRSANKEAVADFASPEGEKQAAPEQGTEEQVKQQAVTEEKKAEEKLNSKDESPGSERVKEPTPPTGDAERVVQKEPEERKAGDTAQGKTETGASAEKQGDAGETVKAGETDGAQNMPEGEKATQQQAPGGKKRRKRKRGRGKKKNGEANPAAQEQTMNHDSWGTWITPENVSSFSNEEGQIPEEEIKVACVTTDYSMQNVLLQMGLKLISVDGMLIKRVNLYLNRCSACFKITMEMDKEFCPKCGNHTLQRMAYTVDAEGNIVLHPSRYKQPKLRGTKYSIPQRKGGRNSDDLILREDEIPVRRRRNKEKDLFDPDHDFLTPRREAANKDYVFGYGRKNPNESRRRTGKKKKNSGTLN